MTPHLNRPLLLEQPQHIPDGAGGLATRWVPLGTLWAAITPGAGSARGDNALPLARVPLRITVRAAPPGSPARPVAGQRFREGSRLYAILAVADRDSAARYLICHATEEAAA